MDLEHAELLWQDTTPLSKRFQDIYYLPENGVAESAYVFLQHNQLEQRFIHTQEKNTSFTILETGFGTGLNFLNAWNLWKTVSDNTHHTHAHLHFVSFELYPLLSSELEKALSAFPELNQLSAQLIAHYPKRVHGFHRINFSNQVSLTLYFGDALSGIQKLANTFKADAFFLDGFNPNHNENLWNAELFQALKKISLNKSTTFATFTAAGHVRRNLESIGFHCEKVKGFGKKREMLKGIFNEVLHPENSNEALIPYTHRPWMHTDNAHTLKQGESIAIIGAGLAGAWTAFKLAERGFKVSVIDKAAQIASGASGNPRGATFFKIPAGDLNSTNRFYIDAYLYSLNTFKQLKLDESIYNPCGLIQLASDHELEHKFKNSTLPSDICQYLDKQTLSEICGLAQQFSGLYFPEAASINPPALCQHLLNHPNIACILSCELTDIRKTESSYTLETLMHGKSKHFNFDVVVLANAHTARQFECCEHLPIHAVRGQSTQIRTTHPSNLKTILCSKAYLTPEYQGVHTIGATFDPRNLSTDVLENDNLNNLAYLKQYSPGFVEQAGDIYVDSARAGLRCQSSDLLPVVGNVCDLKKFNDDFSGITKGQIKKSYPMASCMPGLYMNLAHASRGLISTPYCAEILVNLMLGEASACEQAVLEQLSDRRFYFRALKRSGSK